MFTMRCTAKKLLLQWLSSDGRLRAAVCLCVCLSGDMYLARFQLDEVADGEEHAPTVSDRGSEKKMESPNNTTFIS